MVDDRTQRPFGSTSRQRAARREIERQRSARRIGAVDWAERSVRVNSAATAARRASAPPPHQPPPSWADESRRLRSASRPRRAAAAQVPAANTLSRRRRRRRRRRKFRPPASGGRAARQRCRTCIRSRPRCRAMRAQPRPAHDTHAIDDDDSPLRGPEEDDYYEDEQPSRRRMGILVIAGVFALRRDRHGRRFRLSRAVRLVIRLGAAAGDQGGAAPSKVVPGRVPDPQSSKQITDRVNDQRRRSAKNSWCRAKRRRCRSRRSRASRPRRRRCLRRSGTGVVGTEPKKIRTIAIRPDRARRRAMPAPPDRAGADGAASAAPPVRAIAPAKPRSQRDLAHRANASARPSRRCRTGSRPRRRALPAAAAGRDRARRPTRRCRSVPTRRHARLRRSAPAASHRAGCTAPRSAGGGYVVQVSSQRSEAEAQAAFHSLQAKYPGPTRRQASR